MSDAPARRYALLIAADALEADESTLRNLIADDDTDALLTAPQVINALRALAAVEPKRAHILPVDPPKDPA